MRANKPADGDRVDEIMVQPEGVVPYIYTVGLASPGRTDLVAVANEGDAGENISGRVDALGGVAAFDHCHGISSPRYSIMEETTARLESTPSTETGIAVTAGEDTPRMISSTPSREETIAFGGIPEVIVAGIRSSERIRAQPNADAPQMERAMERAHSRNMSGAAITPKFSFRNISDNSVIARASKLGFSLVKSPSEITLSVKNLKYIEKDRVITILDNNLSINDENPHKLFVSKVSGLCEDLADEDFVGLEDHRSTMPSYKC